MPARSGVRLRPTATFTDSLDLFESIAERRILWRPVPAQFGVTGYFCRYEKHFVYWKVLGHGAIGIVTILHERMHQIAAFRESLPV